MRKPDVARLKSSLSRHRRKLVIGVSALFFLVFASAMAGWFFLPGLIKSKAEKAVAEQLHRKLSIEEIRFNPFSLSVTLKGVTLSERDSEEIFASFDRLYVNVSSLSAFTFSPVIREVELDNPYIHLSRIQDNRYNISDIIEMAMKPDEENKAPLSYSVNNIQVNGGKILFDDHPVKAQHTVEEIRIRLPYISSSPSRIETFIEPHLSARVNGTEMAISGKTRPFAEDRETIFNLALKNIELPRYVRYLPYKPAFHMEKGSLDFDLNLHFAQNAGKAASLDLSGTAQVNSLQLTDAAKKPMLGFDRLAISLDKNAILAGDYHIAKIELVRPQVHAVNSADGHLNLLNLAPSTAKAAPQKEAADGEKRKAAPVKLALSTLAMSDAKLSYTDYSAGKPYSVTANGLNLTVDEVAVDTGEKSARIGKIASNGAALEMTLEKGAAQARPPARTADSGSSGFAVDIGNIDISGWSAHMQNRNLKKPVGAKITGLTVSVQDISTVPGKTSTLNVKANVDKKGHVAISGKLGVAPLFADLAVDLKQVSVVAIQPYIDEHVNLTLRQADVTTKGHLSLSTGKGDALRGGYKGDVSVGNLVTTDQIKGDPFVRWKDFSLRQMEVQFSPFSLRAGRADLDNFYARLILSSEGRLNLQNILRSEAGGKKSLTDDEAPHEAGEDASKAADAPRQETTASPAPVTEALRQAEEVQMAAVTSSAKTAEAKKPASPAPVAEALRQAGEAQMAAVTPPAKTGTRSPDAGDAVDAETHAPLSVPEARVSGETGRLPPIRIDRFQMRNGRIRFTDNFIRPNYTANMDRVHGVITRISSTDNGSAVVDMKGQVNRAPLTVTGSLNPFNPALSLNLEGHVKGMELAQFSSYSAKYVGYGIEKGKLSFDVTYKVENGELHAENRLVLDQLTFGEKSEGKPVISLPVQFAVNLLKDGDGVIDINLPVSGSLNDPEFSVGGIVFRVIVNLIKKAVTAPFSLLAAAFGGGEELSWLEFDPGKTDITGKGLEKLGTLVKALKGRPGLKLDIAGNYDPVADKEGLARNAIDRKVRELKRKSMGAEGENLRPGQIEVREKEYAALLKEVYSDADFKKPRNVIGFQKSLPVAEMEKLMIENYPVTESDFMALADKRAARVKAWLLDEGGISEERIFIQASKSRTGDNAARVDFSLH